MTRRILVADDDAHIRDVVEFALRKAGHDVAVVGDGAAAFEAFEKSVPDLIVLDVGMPRMDGLEVCRRVRRTSEVPILFLSARDDEIDRIIGLEIGGDDYVTKPFSPRELTARVASILRRTAREPGDEDHTRLSHGILSLDQARRHVTVRSDAVALTEREFDLLALLLRRPGVVRTRDDVLDHAYDGNVHVSDRTIDSHVRNLRLKLKSAGCADAVRTVRGVGFALGACEGGAGR